MDVLVTCKYEEYPIKNEGARVVTTLYINIFDAKGQITQKSAWYMVEIRTHPSFHVCPSNLQE